MWRLILAVFFTFLFFSTAFAGAWVQPKGDILIITQAQWYSSCRFWNDNGDINSGSCFRQYQINPYVEYGLTSDLTVGISPFARQAQQSGNSSTGLGDAEIFGRYLLWHNDYSVFSSQLGLNIPFQSNNANTLAIAPTISNGEYWSELRFLYGTGGELKQFAKGFWYTSIESAYQYNMSGAPDQLQFDLTFGWKNPSQKINIELKSYNIIGLNNQSNTQKPNYDLYTLSPGFIYWVKPHIAIELGVSQDVYGKNIGQGTAPFVSIWYRG